MNLLNHAKLALGPAFSSAQSPFRPLSMMACVGLLVAYGSIAVGAIPAAAVTFPQDKDHKKEHNVEIHKLQGDDDGNVEVIVIQDGDSGHQELLQKLKTEHKIDLNKLHADHDGNVEVVVIEGDEHDGDVEKKLHGHLVELLHGPGSAKVDYHELASQLREIADRLDGKSHSARINHELHQAIEIHRDGNHGVHVLKHADLEKANNEHIEILTGEGKRFQVRKSDQPQEMIIEVTPEGNAKVHSLDGDHKKIMLHRATEQDPSLNVIMEKIHVDGKHDAGANELHFGNAKTSDERHKSTLEELRAELENLREELDQLRSKRPDSSGKRLRLKKEQSSTDDEGNDQLVWVEEDDSDKSENKLIWRTSKDPAGKANPNRFRFEFKKKDQESTETTDDKK